MNGLFSMDNKVFMFIGKLVDLVILNIIFLVTCIPVITIGAAVTALYDVTIRMVKNEESYIVKGYLKAFKLNFKQSTIIWSGILVVLIVLYVDLRIINMNTGTLWTVVYMITFSILIWLSIMMSYVFPLQAKFVNSCKNTIKNACIMGVRHLPTTMGILIMNCLFIACLMYNGYTLVYGVVAYMVIGFSIVAYINSCLLVRVFEKYYDNPTDVEKVREI